MQKFLTDAKAWIKANSKIVWIGSGAILVTVVIFLFSGKRKSKNAKLGK
jgi:hypothetical protein